MQDKHDFFRFKGSSSDICNERKKSYLSVSFKDLYFLLDFSFVLNNFMLTGSLFVSKENVSFNFQTFFCCIEECLFTVLYKGLYIARTMLSATLHFLNFTMITMKNSIK